MSPLRKRRRLKTVDEAVQRAPDTLPRPRFSRAAVECESGMGGVNDVESGKKGGRTCLGEAGLHALPAPASSFRRRRRIGARGLT